MHGSPSLDETDIPHEFLPVMYISGSSGKLIQERVGRALMMRKRPLGCLSTAAGFVPYM